MRTPKLAKVGRNDPCPCGSGKKYKKCCGDPGRSGSGPVPGTGSLSGGPGGRPDPASLDWVEGNEPTNADWTRLVEAAHKFQRLAPWDWMWDDDNFGIKDPGTGEVLYCSVLGRIGVQRGLAAYVGSEGLADLFAIQRMNNDEHTNKKVRHRQRALVAFFEDRGELLDHDREIVKISGVRFGDKDRWPAFMDVTPGLFPWTPTSVQVRALTVALEQSCVVAEAFRKDPGCLDPFMTGGRGDDIYDIADGDPVLLVRMLKDPKGRSGRSGPVGGPSEWSSEWFVPPPPDSSKRNPKVHLDFKFDRAGLEDAGDLPLDKRAVWELDFCYSPEPVREGGARPYFPHIVLIVDTGSGKPLFTEIVREMEVFRSLVNGLIESFRTAGARPGRIRVRDSELVKLLKPFTPGKDTIFEVADDLPTVDKAFGSFERYVESERQ